MSDNHWTYAQWEEHTVDKIVTMGLSAPEEYRADYLRLQITLAIRQAHRHAKAGLSENDPIVP